MIKDASSKLGTPTKPREAVVLNLQDQFERA
jgi:hypothetical protein